MECLNLEVENEVHSHDLGDAKRGTAEDDDDLLVSEHISEAERLANEEDLARAGVGNSSGKVASSGAGKGWGGQLNGPPLPKETAEQTQAREKAVNLNRQLAQNISQVMGQLQRGVKQVDERTKMIRDKIKSLGQCRRGKGMGRTIFWSKPPQTGTGDEIMRMAREHTRIVWRKREGEVRVGWPSRGGRLDCAPAFTR